MRDAQELPLHGRERDDDDVVLVVADRSPPFATSMPTTLNGMSLMRTIEPTGSASPNSCFTTLWPEHADLGGAAHVGVGDEHAVLRPATGGRSAKSGVVPWTCVFQFWSPNTTCAKVRTVGATASTAGHSRLIAAASSGVSVVMPPIAAVRAAGGDRAGDDHDDVRAHRADLRLHRRARALADRERGDHGRHADHDAEHGERRAHAVARERVRARAG